MDHHFFSQAFAKAVEQAIVKAEKQTSCEFKVHIEEHCNETLLDRAAFVFSDLQLHRTQARNAVLLYLTTDDRKIAFLADTGANAHLSSDFLSSSVQKLQTFFAKDQFADGIDAVLSDFASLLAGPYPYQENDINEIPDALSR
jgi:uncharacterized membrane protein